jgi:cell division septation protein DedD
MNPMDYLLTGKLIGSVILMTLAVVVYAHWFDGGGDDT